MLKPVTFANSVAVSVASPAPLAAVEVMLRAKVSLPKPAVRVEPSKKAAVVVTVSSAVVKLAVVEATPPTEVPEVAPV